MKESRGREETHGARTHVCTARGPDLPCWKRGPSRLEPLPPGPLANGRGGSSSRALVEALPSPCCPGALTPTPSHPPLRTKDTAGGPASAQGAQGRDPQPHPHVLGGVEGQCGPVRLHGGRHHRVKQQLPQQLLVAWGKIWRPPSYSTVVGSSAHPHPRALSFRHETCFELEEVGSGGQEAASSASTVRAEPRDRQAFPALGLHETRRPTRQPPSPPSRHWAPSWPRLPERLNLPRGLRTPWSGCSRPLLARTRPLR